jgi:hypothetical protein
MRGRRIESVGSSRGGGEWHPRYRSLTPMGNQVSNVLHGHNGLNKRGVMHSFIFESAARGASQP